MNTDILGGYTAPSVRRLTVMMATTLVALAVAIFLGAKPAEAQTLPTIDPATIDLGGIEVNVESDPVSVTITNPQGSLADIKLGALSLTGPNAADFTILTPVAGITLAPGESQIIELSVTPSATGPLSADLNVPILNPLTNQPIVNPLTGQPLSLTTNLTGTGVAPGGGGGTPGTPGANTKPTVSVDKPAGDKVKKRKPTIIATARDAQEELTASDIKVFLKGKEITSFTYDQATDKVQFKPDKKLKRGKQYTVRITATDAQGLTGSAEKTFKVKKK